MKFKEILKEVKKGKKFRRKIWAKDFFIWYELSDFYCESKKKGKKKEEYPFCMSDFEGDDWELVGGNEDLVESKEEELEKEVELAKITFIVDEGIMGILPNTKNMKKIGMLDDSGEKMWVDFLTGTADWAITTLANDCMGMRDELNKLKEIKKEK